MTTGITSENLWSLMQAAHANACRCRGYQDDSAAEGIVIASRYFNHSTPVNTRQGLIALLLRYQTGVLPLKADYRGNSG